MGFLKKVLSRLTTCYFDESEADAAFAKFPPTSKPYWDGKRKSAD